MRIVSRLCGAYAAAMFLTWTSPARSFCPPPTLPDDTSLLAYVTEWKATIPKAGSDGFIRPPREDRESFALALEQLFAGFVDEACTSFDALNYDLLVLDDSTVQRSYFIARERSDNHRGSGMYVVDPSYARNLVVEVPHPLYDMRTEEEGVKILLGLGARGLFLAGTHRCANEETSQCSGTTSACGDAGPYRISDAAHYTQTYFQSAHAVTLQLSPVASVIQLHGQSSEPFEIELSNGTKEPQPDTATVNRLRDALLQRGVNTASCNWEEDDPESLNLCGVNNTQGRLSNGSGNVCRSDAPTGSGFFLHFEQRLNLRNDPTVLIDALAEVLWEDPADAPAEERRGRGVRGRSRRR